MESLEREYYLLRQYMRETSKCMESHPKWFGWLDAVLYFQPWRRKRNADGHCLEHEIPWMTFPSINRLSSFLSPEMRVFEYGSGGSTLFFARRTKEVISIEHDKEWYDMLALQLEEEEVDNCTVFHIPPSKKLTHENKDPSDPDSYVSSSERYEGKSFHDYATKIEDYSDNYFDVVVVDGRARPSCFKHAIQKVSSRGMLVFDNTSRDHYQDAMALAPPNFKYRRYPGPTPFLGHFTETSVWEGQRA